MKKCAYCYSKGKLTIEHIFPKWIIKRQPESNARFARHENRVSERVPTIKDVCASCNNVALSMLDENALVMYEKYFERTVLANTHIRFEYDYDLLARWVLKVVFNSARKNNTRPDEFEPLISYILGKSSRPLNFRLFALLLIPHKLSSRMRERLAKEGKEIAEFPPRNISVTQFGVKLSEENMLVLGRAVLINSYCFIVSILPPTVPRVFRRKALRDITEHFERMYKGIQVLDPRFRSVRLGTSELDSVAMKRDSIRMYKKAYDDYSARRRKTENGDR